ncbi:alcohol dehydrogenase catalytic domain-containing protein [Streptomyces sp. NPDC018711]|uniref:alcohol dehydrogenase catalytic domain-containing protein n=1 Tax=Streptomyces sp. NPDC018711 TaxID=3365052 RepID=UPI0037BAA906
MGTGMREPQVGDRVVVPFDGSCDTCFMCVRGLHAQCETAWVLEHGTGAGLFGDTELHGQAEYMRVPFADTLPVRLPERPPEERPVSREDV